MNHYKHEPPRLKPLQDEDDYVWNLFHPLSIIMFAAAAGYALSALIRGLLWHH